MKYQFIKKLLALSPSDVVFIMLINVKMPTIVGILTLMSRVNFVLSYVKHEKSYMTLRPDLNFIGRERKPSRVIFTNIY